MTVKWENDAAQLLFGVKGISVKGKVQLHSRAEVEQTLYSQISI